MIAVFCAKQTADWEFVSLEPDQNLKWIVCVGGTGESRGAVVQWRGGAMVVVTGNLFHYG